MAVHNLVRWQQDCTLARQVRIARAQSLPTLAATPRVSVLVAAWNEASMIAQHIESVLGLRYPAVEYVVCAGGDDGTFEIAQRYARPGVIVLEQRAGAGKQAALRQCLAQASGEIIFLTDADCLLDDRCFERTLGPIVRREAVATSGASRPLPELAARHALAAYRWSADAYVAAHGAAQTTGLLGRNAAIARRALEGVGAFDDDVPSGTDYHLAKALRTVGIRIRHVPDSEVLTRDEGHPVKYARQQRRWLRNVVLQGLAAGAYDEVVAALRTSLLGVGMLLAPVASLFFGRVLLSLWIVALGHGALSKLRYRGFVAITHDGPLTLGPRACANAVLFTLLEFAVGALPLADYLVPSRRRTW
jgi:hypothetical protein